MTWHSSVAQSDSGGKQAARLDMLKGQSLLSQLSIRWAWELGVWQSVSSSPGTTHAFLARLAASGGLLHERLQGSTPGDAGQCGQRHVVNPAMPPSLFPGDPSYAPAPQQAAAPRSSWAVGLCWLSLGQTSPCGHFPPNLARRQYSSSASSAAGADPRAASPSQPSNPGPEECPLHVCLRQYGISNLEGLNKPKQLAMSQETVDSSVVPKLAVLRAEGLSAPQMLRLFCGGMSVVSCNYEGTFLPNLELLRKFAALKHHRPNPQAPQLTAVGLLLARSPSFAARYLARDHGKVLQVLDWLEGSLGIGLAELAGCNGPLKALTVSAGAAAAVKSMLELRQVPVEAAARMFHTQPRFFGTTPATLAARLETLQQELGLDGAAAMRLLVQQPALASGQLHVRVPPLLGYLDDVMGQEGAGRRLVLRSPVLATNTVATAQQAVLGLAARGYSREEIAAMVNKSPTVLSLNLGSPLQQQKLEWIDSVSPWTLDDFLATPKYLAATTRRLASRVDFMQQHGLGLPSTPASLATVSDARFMASMLKRLHKAGVEPMAADWGAWENWWLGTAAGRQWGFPPLAFLDRDTQP